MRRRNTFIFLGVAVGVSILVLLLAGYYLFVNVLSAATTPNARCPYCGTRFRIEGLDDMVRFQREMRFRECPGCKQPFTCESYRRTFREDK